MDVTLITGVHEALKYLDSWFELNEFEKPMHSSQIAEKVKNFTHKGDIEIYTQSQDVFNGFRVRMSKGTINSLTCLHYWGDKVHTIIIDKNGRTNCRTKGFFDQVDKDLNQLLGI